MKHETIVDGVSWLIGVMGAREKNAPPTPRNHNSWIVITSSSQANSSCTPRADNEKGKS